MANNITNIYFSNTFGDLVRTANNIVNAFNYLGFQDWDKPTGQFSISSSGDGFVANTSAVFRKDTRVEGISSSLYVQNNAEIGKKLSLTDRANNETFYSNGVSVFANGSSYTSYLDKGYNVITVGNSLFANNVDILKTANVNFTNSNSLFISLNTSGNTAQFSGDVLTANLVSNSFIYAADNITTSRNSYVGLSQYVGSDSFVTSTSYTSRLQANTNANTATLSVTGTGFVNTLQANTNVNTATLSVTGNSFTKVLQANTSANTATLSVTCTGFVNNLQANSKVNTATLSVTGAGFVNTMQANTSILTGVVQANTSVNTATLSVTGNSFTKVLQANTSVNTATLSVTGTSFVNILQANTSVNTNIISAATIGILNPDESSSVNNLNSNNAIITNAVISNLTVSGKYTITGTSSYEGLNIGLSSNTPIWFSDRINSPAELIVNRTYDAGNNIWYSSNADAALSWSETSKRWRVVNVTASIANTNPSYRNILITDDINNDLVNTSITRVASANTLTFTYNTAFAANTTANLANTTANLANTTANLANTTAFVANTTANLANTTANLANTTAFAANTTANLANTTANLANTTANLANTTAFAANTTANLANTTANLANTTAFAANTTANLANTTAFAANTKANDAYNLANSAITVTGSGVTITGSPVKLGGTLNIQLTSPSGVASITGTTNQITATDSGGGNYVLSTPQNTHTGAIPTFAGINLNGSAYSNTRLVASGSIPTPSGINNATSGLGSIEIKGPDNLAPAMMAFNIPGKSGGQLYFGLDDASLRFMIGGWSAGTTANTIALSSDKLSFFATTTSSELGGIISDKTGSGSLVFANSPTLSGSPLTPTAASGTSNTMVASTAFAANATNLTSGTIPGDRGVSAGSAISSFIEYNGTTKTIGQFDGGSSAPTNTTRLNYDGNFYATTFYGAGTGLTGTASSLTAGLVTNGVYTTGSYSNPAWITSLAKSKVGLTNVEDVALSTWAGSTNLTTIGNATAQSLVVSGDLIVNGTTTNVNSTVVTIDDPILTLGGDTSVVDIVKDRGIEVKWNGTTLSMTNFIGNGTTLVTGTVASTSGYSAGDIITISGATGTEQSKLNGTWTISNISSGTTFQFTINTNLTSQTYTSGLGTIVKTKNAFFGLDQSTGKFTFIPQALNSSEVFDGTPGIISANTFESVATNIAPFTVSSSVVVTNLNADKLDGQDGTYYSGLVTSANTWLQSNDAITLTSAKSYTDSVTKTYTDGNGIGLSGLQFFVEAGTGLTQSANGLSLTSITAGSSTTGAIAYSGTTKTEGQFYGGTTTPDGTTRLNYNGDLYANNFVGTINGNNSATANTPNTLVLRDSSGNISANVSTFTEVRSYGDIIAYYSSDERLKENVISIQSPIDKIKKINGYTFDWTDEYLNSKGVVDNYFFKKHDIGVIAQEIEVVLPELVVTKPDGYKAVKYEKLVALLIESIKEQQKSIEALQSQIDELRK